MTTAWYYIDRKRSFKLLLLLIGLSLTVVNCAKRGSPTGGPSDSLPPVFVKAIPPNFTTNFEDDEIRIYFDEFIKLKDFQKQFIASPPLSNTVVSPQGTASKFISIELRDTLEANTTYVFNFGLSIADNNEGNAFPSFKYVMSTGDYIDSLTVKGTIIDAVAPTPDNYVTVMLYEVDTTYTDSVVYKEKPRYVTNTLDSLTTFELDYLREGTYAIVALKDEDANFTFQPKKDKIAFLEEFITVPTDSTYSLKLFSENLSYKVSRPKHVAQGRIAFGITGNIDSVSIDMISKVSNQHTSLITQKGEDTLYYWYKPRVESDSLLFRASALNFEDTLVTTMRTPKEDSLQLKALNARTLLFDASFDFTSNIPLDSINKSLISVTRDSTAVAFEATLDKNRTTVALDFNKVEKSTYEIEVLPGAFTDFFGHTNDTLTASPRIKELADYGDIELTLVNADNFPYIIELLDPKGEVSTTRYTKGETVFKFPFLSPGNYRVRLIEDKNDNKIYDTGNYLKKRQPERIINFPGTIEVRPSWYKKERIILKSKEAVKDTLTSTIEG